MKKCRGGERGAPSQPRSSPQQTPVQYLLPEAKAQDSDKICVVIDLDETLVHSSFKVGLPGSPQPWCGGACLAWEGRLGRPGRSSSRSFPP